MSKKYSITTADYLRWDQNLNLIRKLYHDGDYKMSLLISLGSFWGLRIGDLLQIKWSDILNKNEFILSEMKTMKTRNIKIKDQLKEHITDCYEKLQPCNLDDFIFKSQKGTVYSIQRINVLFKNIKNRYSLDIKNFSTHSLRKTFGRQIFNISGTNSEMALIKLSQMFNHSNIAITRRYLGISQEEIFETYDLLEF